MEKLFIDETYQKRWKRTWAVAMVTCGLGARRRAPSVLFK